MSDHEASQQQSGDAQQGDQQHPVIPPAPPAPVDPQNPGATQPQTPQQEGVRQDEQLTQKDQHTA